jgi:hypothetical protein
MNDRQARPRPAAEAEDGERKRRAPESATDLLHDDEWIGGGRP